MTVDIYCIEHIESGKKYIGKSINIEKRLSKHKGYLTRAVMVKSQTNRHLWNAVQKYGWDAFKSYIIEEVSLDDVKLSERELHWIDTYNTVDRDFGYNLRRDSSTKMIVHDETKELIRLANTGKKHTDETKRILHLNRTGDKNPMYGKELSDEHRQRLRESGRVRIFTAEHRKNLSVSSKGRVVSEETKDKQSRVTSKFCYDQYSLDGVLIRSWESLRDIGKVLGFRGENICAAATGHAKTYKGFIWKKVPKELKQNPLTPAASSV